MTGLPTWPQLAFTRVREGLRDAGGLASILLASPTIWLVWALLRLFGVLALHGVLPYNHVFPSDGDVSEYWGWSNALWHGQIPFRDYRLPYPPGILPILFLPPISLSWFKAEYLVAALVVDALVLRALIRHNRPTGASLWLVAAPLLGPIFWSRLDIFVAGMLVAALLAFEQGRYSRAAFWLTWAALIKLWPAFALLPLISLVPRERRTRFVCAAAATLAVGLMPFMALGATRSLWSIIEVQTGRGVEFESIFAVPLYALAAAGHSIHLTVSTSVQFTGPTDALVSAISMGLFLAAACFYVYRALRHSSRFGDPARWILLCVAILITTNKVLSAQYLVWVAASVAVFIDRAQMARRLFLITAFLLFATQLQFPLGFPQMLVGSPLALQLSVMHAVMVIAFAGVLLRAIHCPDPKVDQMPLAPALVESPQLALELRYVHPATVTNPALTLGQRVENPWL